MAVRGVYSKEVQKMLEEWRSAAPQYVGWIGDDPIPVELSYPVYHRVASKDLILNMANGISDPNPLWRDENYAAKTRWGTILAPPYFEHTICHHGPVLLPKVPQEVGPAVENHLDHWEFYKPIRLGDSFRVWTNSYTIEDATRIDGKGPHTFLAKYDQRFFNQKNELVCNKRRTRIIFILPPAEKGKEPALDKISQASMDTVLKVEEYKYTEEELDFIERVHDEEIIRGAKIRWWEDVNVGDDLQTVVLGPVTPWDAVMEIAGCGLNVYDTRLNRKLTPQASVLDPETGIWHKTISTRIVDKVARLKKAYEPQAHVIMREHTLTRLISNWIGDDGFLKMTEWDENTKFPMGDTCFGRGKVIKKYVLEDGEHVVDLACWLEGIRGMIHIMGRATVGLLSREGIDKDLLRY